MSINKVTPIRVVLMPVRHDAEEMARQRAEVEDSRAARAISIIQRTYGVTQFELSDALGVFAPEVGKKGTSVIGKWKRGSRTPSSYHLALLEMLASGELELELTDPGKDGRSRRVFTVVPTERAAA